MSERIRGSYDDVLSKSTYTLLYLTIIHEVVNFCQLWLVVIRCHSNCICRLL